EPQAANINLSFPLLVIAAILHGFIKISLKGQIISFYLISNNFMPGNRFESTEHTCVSKCIARYMDAWNIVSRTYIARIQKERQAQSLGLDDV
ncbi:unnamed protein product, partial [Pneumocystis jirovecii]